MLDADAMLRIANYLATHDYWSGDNPDDWRWTTERVAELIEQRTSVRFHRAYVGRLLRMLGFRYDRKRRDWRARVGPFTFRGRQYRRG